MLWSFFGTVALSCALTCFFHSLCGLWSDGEGYRKKLLDGPEVCVCVWTQRQSKPLRCAGHFSVHNTGFPPLNSQLGKKKRYCYLDTQSGLLSIGFVTHRLTCALFSYSLYLSLWVKKKAHENPRKNVSIKSNSQKCRCLF